MSKVPRPLLLGLKFRERHSQVLQDELDNLLATLQGQFGHLGVYTPLPAPGLTMRLADGNRWVPSANPYYTRVGYALSGGLLWMSYHLAQTSLLANANPWLGLPPGLRVLDDFMCQIPCIITTNSAGTVILGYAYVEGRQVTAGSLPATYIAFSKSDGSAWSTTANDVTIDGQIVMPYQQL